MSRVIRYDFTSNPSLTDHNTSATTKFVSTTPDLGGPTRATVATERDADGWLREFQSGEARFRGATFSSNLIFPSHDFATTWVNVNSIDAGGQADPFGGTDAFKVTDDSSGGSKQCYIYRVATLHPGQRFFISLYAKADQTNWLCLQTVGAVEVGRAYFDLGNGVVGSGDGGATFDHGIESVGNGWYRCWLQVDGSTETASNIQCQLYTAGGDLSRAVTTADGSNSIYMYGCQVESSTPSMTGPTSLVETTSAAASSLSGTSTRGLLVEEARTNICLQSEDFSTTWTSGVEDVVNTNQTTAPDGSSTADQLIDDGVGTTAEIAVLQTITTATSTSYALSCFVKADQLDWCQLRVVGMAAQAISAFYDLTNGAVGATVGADVDATGIEDYGNGWYRCWLTFTSDGTDTSASYRIYAANGDNDTTVDIDGTSSIYLWGAQLEVGSVPSSYIRTTTGTVTRNSDDDVEATGLSAILNDSAGTMVAKFTQAIDSDAASTMYVFNVADSTAGGAAEAHSIQVRTAAEGVQGNTKDASVNQANIAFTDATWSDVRSGVGVYSWEVNDFDFYFDGSQGTPDTSGTLPSSLSVIYVGQRDNALHFNGYIEELEVYDTKLSEHEMYEASIGNDPLAVDPTPELAAYWDFTVASRGLAAVAGPTPGLTRATSAWDTDDNGYIREYRSGEARFPGATFNHNLVLQSQTFDNAAWTKTRTTVSADAVVAPDGTSTADTIVTTSAGSTSYWVGESSSGTIEDSTTYRISVYAKAAGFDEIFLASNSPGAGGVYFNLANGTAGTSVEIALSVDAKGVVDEGDGWYRCWFILSGNVGTDPIRIFIADSENTTITGDGTNGVSLWGAMNEKVPAGTTSAPGAYIPTTAAAVSSLSGTALGLRQEAAKTNICLQSEDFSTTWTLTDQGARQSNQTVAPDGSSTADKLKDNEATGTGTAKIVQILTVANATQYTMSVFAKADGLDWMYLAFDAETCYFDLTNGVVGTSTATSEGIQDYGNGWYRCWITATTSSTTGVFEIRVSGGDGSVTVDLDGTSSIFVWGAQLEVGPGPSTYIRTTTGSATRNLEDIFSSDVTWYDDDRGTLYAEGYKYVSLEANRYMASIHSGVNDYVAIGTNFNGASGEFRNYVTTGNDGASSGGTMVFGTLHRLAGTYQVDDVALYFDGVKAAGDTTATLQTSPTEIVFGSDSNGGNDWNGIISKIAYWNGVWDEASLLALTADGTFPSAGGGRTLTRSLARDLTRGLTRAKADS